MTFGKSELLIRIDFHIFWAETLVAYSTGDRFPCCTTLCAAIFSTEIYHNASFFSCDVLWQERMGTAFSHEKLSGNGVPTREFLR